MAKFSMGIKPINPNSCSGKTSITTEI